MRRFFIFFLCILVIFSFAVVVSAEVIYPEDYTVYKETVDGVSTLYVDLPAKAFTQIKWSVLNADNYAVIESGNGVSFRAHFIGEAFEDAFWVECRPFAGDRLVIDDVITGSIMSVSFNITTDINTDSFVGGGRIQVRYYDAYDNQIGNVQFVNMSSISLGSNLASFVVDKPEGAVYISFLAQFQDFYFDTLPLNIWFTFNGISITMDVDSASDLELELGTTNRLLESIRDGSIEPIVPDGNSSVNDYIDSESSLLDGISDGESSAEDVLLSFGEKILLYLNGFFVFATIFNLFTELSFVDVLLTVSLALGLFSLLFGATMSHFRKE